MFESIEAFLKKLGTGLGFQMEIPRQFGDQVLGIMRSLRDTPMARTYTFGPMDEHNHVVQVYKFEPNL